MVLENKVRDADPGRRVAQRLRRARWRHRYRRRAAAASRRTPARSAPRSRRWSPVSRRARRSTSPSTPRCASSDSRPRRLVNTLSALVARDAAAYTLVTDAYKLPSEPADAAEKREGGDRRRADRRRARCRSRRRAPAPRSRTLAATCATKGNTNAVSDAGVAALLADAACRGAVYNVRINVSSLDDKSRGAGSDRGSEPASRADEAARRGSDGRGREGNRLGTRG